MADAASNLPLPLLGASKDKASCFHCGLPVASGGNYAVRIAGVTRRMCCPGCQAVAQAIADAGLSEYYHHRSALPSGAAEAVPKFLRHAQAYDLPEVQQSFVRQEHDAIREASVILEGIVCAACIWLNERHIAALPGVLSAQINYSTRRARIRWDNRAIRFSDILRAIAQIGYTAHPFDPRRQEQIFFAERKAMLQRLFVAGMGMSQVMMYAIPVYLARDGEMPADIAQLMRLASLALTLPVITYSSWPFFQGAWRDLKRRRTGMDVPVALGVGSAFLASLWATLQGAGEVYYDSITMFVFFLLCGRFLELGARRKSAEAAETLAQLTPAVASRLHDYPNSQANEQVAVSQLRLGDYVLIRPGEAVPADGKIERGASEVDEALLTGESKPIAKCVGDTLTGGAMNMANPLVMKVERLGEDTMLSTILRLLDRAQSEKPRIAQTADRVAGWFVMALLLIAAGVAFAWYVIDPSRAFWITVSVLVVSCPCALSLATPAALTAATGTLTKLGLLVTRGHALETLAKTTHFVFDKTGSLTFGRMTLLNIVPLRKSQQDILLLTAAQLELGSEHPIAQALLAAVPPTSRHNLPAAPAVQHLPGNGIEGTIAGRRYRIGKPAFVAALHHQPLPPGLLEGDVTTVTLGDEEGWLAWMTLGDRIRPEAHTLITALKNLGKQICLLSGDHAGAAQRVADSLGIACVEADMSPQNKFEFVHRLQSEGAVVAMLGDGVNDAPVLAAAQVSIAMGNGAQLAQTSADMVLLSENLIHLADGLKIAIKTSVIIRQNLAWALLYNVLALPLAALGYVTPWMAGVGMSLSSLLVVLNALRVLDHPSSHPRVPRGFLSWAARTR